MKKLFVFLISCGPLSEPILPPTPLPPNVETACMRAIRCGVFLYEQKPECLRCVEKLAELWNDKGGGELPPIETIDCQTIAQVSARTLVSECVVRRSFGP